MKITKTLLRKIIKEEVEKELMSRSNLNEGQTTGQKVILALLLAATGATAAALAKGPVGAAEAEKIIQQASPQQMAKAQGQLDQLLGSVACSRMGGR